MKISLFFMLYVALYLLLIIAYLYQLYFSEKALKKKEAKNYENQTSKKLIQPEESSLTLGHNLQTSNPIFLPHEIRKKHVHILGSTGSGKTESVILNFIKQDFLSGFGSIILDAKGDQDFLDHLKSFVPDEKLRVFDLLDPNSLSYNPLEDGSPLESAQRLFSSLNWSEEYYQSKALTALQKLFGIHFKKFKKNPDLSDLYHYLENDKNYSNVVSDLSYTLKNALKDYQELSGLIDQVKTLNSDHLSKILSDSKDQIHLKEIFEQKIVYFRLQSLLSPKIVEMLGKLIINHLSYLSGSSHRTPHSNQNQFYPVYLDEFASFVCPEFTDLISKARSAHFALHFSHQSIGDLTEKSDSILARITDNSATKIVLRIHDPDSAEYMARTFGTVQFQKMTQRVTKSNFYSSPKLQGEGSQRDAHQFRASPDHLKTLATGTGAVLIAHGQNTPHGASSVFHVQFPRFKRNL